MTIQVNLVRISYRQWTKIPKMHDFPQTFHPIDTPIIPQRLQKWLGDVSRLTELGTGSGPKSGSGKKPKTPHRFLHRVLSASLSHPFCAQRDPLVKRMIFYKNFKKFHKKLNWKFSSETQKICLVEIKKIENFRSQNF